MSNNEQCLDLLINGNCTKGEDCPYCNKKELSNITFNVNAKSYVPKSKRTDTKTTTQATNPEAINSNSEKLSTDLESKLKFNLNANEYVPKSHQPINVNGNGNHLQQEEEDFDGEEFDMIMKDIIDNEVMEEIEDEEESDDEKWFPKYKDCECCKGFVYKCKGAACANMGLCYCKIKEECDEEDS